MLVKPADDFCMKNASTLQATPQAWVQHEARGMGVLACRGRRVLSPADEPVLRAPRQEAWTSEAAGDPLAVLIERRLAD
jgi:hypothetical protein